MSERPTDNPFASSPEVPSGPSGSTAGPSAAAPPNGSGGEAKVTGYLQSYPELAPATGYPVWNSGGAFSTSYPHWGSTPSYPSYTQQAEATQPLYTFEQSAPAAQSETRPPLACGCGLQWVLFACGWLFPPVWYVGVILRYIGTFDPRERPGWVANCVLSVVFTIVWVVIVIDVVDKSSGGSSGSGGVYCDPTGMVGCL